MSDQYARGDGVTRTEQGVGTKIKFNGGHADWLKTTGMTAAQPPGHGSEYLKRHAAQNELAAADADRLYQIGKAARTAAFNAGTVAPS